MPRSFKLQSIAQTLLCVALVATPGLVAAQAQAGSMAATAATSPLGDLSGYRTMAEDALKLAKAGDIAGARKRLKELETTWDNHEDANKKKSYNRWKAIDNQVDFTLDKLSAKKPDQAACEKAIADLIARLR
ncbi:MAG TPA: histidine kinase [Casimicrobiaceae bacterium]|nr:histidine kinase [Casimicrobiaceae bacterium]